jgi:hypothetical protein
MSERTDVDQTPPDSSRSAPQQGCADVDQHPPLAAADSKHGPTLTASTTESDPGMASKSGAAQASRILIHSSTGRDQDAGSLSRIDLTAWRRLLVLLRGLRDTAAGPPDSSVLP